MMKSAYLLVTDLHIASSKANRLNYLGEILNSLSQIMQIAEKYKAQGYTVNLFLLGDIFDSSITNASDAMQLMEIFRFFCSDFDKVWAVVGNHEITYAKDNPFWFMVAEVGDEELQKVKRYLQPRGIMSTVNIVDRVIDGEVTFYLNHYGTPPKVPDMSGVRIGLFHQNIGSTQICQMYGVFDDVEKVSYIQAYNYGFFGHMHLAKGKFYLNESHTCLCEWLGTIGRTKINEVSDKDLEVNIPVVKIEDGNFKGIDDNSIFLLSEADAIDKNKVIAESVSKKLIEQHRQSAVASYKGETLHETIKLALSGTQLAFLFEFFDNDYDRILQSYIQTLNNTTLDQTTAMEE